MHSCSLYDRAAGPLVHAADSVGCLLGTVDDCIDYMTDSWSVETSGVSRCLWLTVPGSWACAVLQGIRTVTR